MKIYKVMTQKDRAFGGKFNPEKVEEALNGLAKEGWEVTGVVLSLIHISEPTRPY